MKIIQKTLILAVTFFTFNLQAQTVDEILATYFENIGGLEKLKSIEGFKMTGKLTQGNMVLPLELVQLKSGKGAMSFDVQGKEFKQNVFDGETLWGTNFMSMKAEKSDAEATANHKLDANDFPDPFVDYKEKGYKVELVGKETIDGAETFKVKLVKEPVTIDGKEEESINYYFFDTENFVPLAMQSEIKSGEGKGMTLEITFGDYQEVDGLYFPFSMTQGVKGQSGSPLVIEKIELNPKIDESVFAFPEVVETAAPTKAKN